jgi:hypothetical protein
MAGNNSRLAISSKRYVLFNLDEQRQPIIRKASAHGLGHLIAPYGSEEAPPNIPAPAVPLSEIGVDRWHMIYGFKSSAPHWTAIPRKSI